MLLQNSIYEYRKLYSKNKRNRCDNRTSISNINITVDNHIDILILKPMRTLFSFYSFFKI